MIALFSTRTVPVKFVPYRRIAPRSALPDVMLALWIALFATVALPMTPASWMPWKPVPVIELRRTNAVSMPSSRMPA